MRVSPGVRSGVGVSMDEQPQQGVDGLDCCLGWFLGRDDCLSALVS